MPKRTLFVAFAIGWLAILTPAGAQADPIISVGSFPVNPVPSYLPTPPTGAFYVPVEISGAAGLQSWQFSLNYDSTVVEVVDPGDGSSGTYGAEFTPGDVNSQSSILSSGFRLPGVVDGVAGSYPLLPSGPSGDGVLADILFEFVSGQENNNPNFSITNASVFQAVPGPEAGSLNLLAALALVAAFFAVHRVQRENPMKKSLLAVASAITILASGSVSAQTIMNGPYYSNPSWDQTLPAAQRFIVLSNMNNEAVLDRETGLVWQRTPEVVTKTRNYQNAIDACWETSTGGRKGWRLPAPEELMSLVDPTQSIPALPFGHPFLQVYPPGQYWTIGTISPTTGGGFIFNFSAVGGAFIGFADQDAFFAGVWCTRGGSHIITDVER